MGLLARTGSKLLLVVFALGISVNLLGQADLSGVYDAFNQGVQMMKINPDAALTSFEKAVELADEVGGDEALEVKSKAMKQIPKMYWESAKKLAGKKDYDGAVEKLDECITAAKEVDDKSQASRALSTILSIYNAQGTSAFKGGDNQAALGFFDQALSRRPKYAKAYLGKVLVYDAMGDTEKMEETAVAGLEVAASTRDNKTAGGIKQKMRGTYFNLAQDAMKEKNYSGVVENLNKSVEYGNNNSMTFYQLGLGYKGISKWNESIEAFNKSLELDMGSDADKAKIYFELGGAYQAVSNNAKACESYKKALYGEFEEAAKYQIESVLKCDN